MRACRRRRPAVVAGPERPGLVCELRLDLALEEEEALLECVVVPHDEAARRVLDDHQVELARAGVGADDDLRHRTADVPLAEAGEADAPARLGQRGDVEVALAIGSSTPSGSG